MNGIYFGKDSTVAIFDEFYIAYLRLGDGRIVSFLKHKDDGVLGIVSGEGEVTQFTNQNGTEKDSLYCIKGVPSGVNRFNDEHMSVEMEAHNNDSFTLDSKGNMTYTMYNGTVFSLTLGEEVGEDYFDRKEYDDSLPAAQKMALWNICKYFEPGEERIFAMVNTMKHSIYFDISYAEDYIYCRVGQNGYCEKGWAMRSTTCIRGNECRMIENNLDTAKDYVPDERWFVEGSCNFPPDGGWYWSLKSVEDNVIYLNGCGGSTYIIRKKLI